MRLFQGLFADKMRKKAVIKKAVIILLTNAYTLEISAVSGKYGKVGSWQAML